MPIYEGWDILGTLQDVGRYADEKLTQGDVPKILSFECYTIYDSQGALGRVGRGRNTEKTTWFLLGDLNAYKHVKMKAISWRNGVGLYIVPAA